VNEVQDKLKDILGKRGVGLRDKFQAVLARNPGFEVMVFVSEMLKGNENSCALNMSPADVALLKFCPLVTAVCFLEAREKLLKI